MRRFRNGKVKASPWDSVISVARERIGWTKKVMAHQFDKNVATISKVENRTMVCPLELAFKYAEFLECDIADIFGKDGMALRMDESRFQKELAHV